jgi:hypothetical protein
MATRFELALELTREEHNQSFEHFANAFLLPDYPELEALGGKHDGAIDARIIDSETGAPLLVVQSCVSPKERAKTKILNTVKVLEGRKRLPPTLVYCTPAKIGDSLDGLKRDLRRDKRVSLEVHDFGWLSQREHSTSGRSTLSDRYASEILAPLQQQIDPSKLYSTVLSDKQERLAFQYLEAQKLDQQSGRNLTKRIHDGLIICALRDTSSPDHMLARDNLLKSLGGIFPVELQTRAAQIIGGRLEHLANRGVLATKKDPPRYALSDDKRALVEQNIRTATDRDVTVHAAILKAIAVTITDREIDYDVDTAQLAHICHSCILWHMKKQAEQFVDPYTKVAHAFYADQLRAYPRTLAVRKATMVN